MRGNKIKAFCDSVKAELPLLNQPAPNAIDLTKFSGYNDFKVIYLLGMAFAGALLSRNLSSDEKLKIIETEYDIPIEGSIRKDVSIMCNLSQGIREDANAEFIMSMYKKATRWNRLQMWQRKALKKSKLSSKRESLYWHNHSNLITQAIKQ